MIKFISWALIAGFFILFLLLVFLRQSFGAGILLFFRNFSGGFYYRPLGSIQYYPLIWFQASIFVMPLAIYSLFKKNFILFSFLCLVVFLSLNRTGSFLIIFTYFISLIKNRKSIARYFLYFIFILPIAFIIGCLIISMMYSTNISVDSGFAIRLGHVISVMEYMKSTGNFFLGMGADSLFVTIGREGDGIVRNQEISFLEVFRRFGIIGYFLFNFGLFVSLLHFYNRANWGAFYSLIAYIIFSFTNPSLISIIFVIFYAVIASTEVKRVYSRNNHNLQSGS
ncbi:MAG TPA: hypothetical protein DIT07_12405 [Sphingobacteriaceae bacterium]|nr:hypothetical protein [Sphingobacteriaceae bacterium]